MTKDTTPARGRGRPEINEADRMKVGSMRLTPKQWQILAALGGVDWLRATLDASAKVLDVSQPNTTK